MYLLKLFLLGGGVLRVVMSCWLNYLFLRIILFLEDVVGFDVLFCCKWNDSVKEYVYFWFVRYLLGVIKYIFFELVVLIFNDVL